MILNALTSIPDNYQSERINMIMTLNHGENKLPLGLMIAVRHFYNVGPGSMSSYSHEVDYYERYIHILKEMIHAQPLLDWMEEHRNFWHHFERDLFEPLQNHFGPSQSRGDYSVRRDNGDIGMHLDHNQQSDSDGLPRIEDSDDEDDEESRFTDNPDQYCEVSKIILSNAGNVDVNGIYSRDGTNEGAHKFSRVGIYDGKRSVYSIFKCNVSNNTKHWYISVVPHGSHPGTSNDVDFYSASVSADCLDLPPANGWTKVQEGLNPPPTLSFEKDDTEPTPVPPYENSPEHNVGRSYV